MRLAERAASNVAATTSPPDVRIYDKHAANPLPSDLNLGLGKAVARLYRLRERGAKLRFQSHWSLSVSIGSPSGVQRDADACVGIIDDERDFRESLGRLLRSVGIPSKAFASVADYLADGLPDGPACLILDVRLPGRSGLDFQRDLALAGIDVPIIFITGYGDIPMTVQAMKAGAIEFLTKPFREQDLLDAVNIGLARDRSRRANRKATDEIRARLDSLTPRERAILDQIVAGRLNKQIASDMGITEATVKVHRSNLMHKVNAASFAELCRMVDRVTHVEEGGPGGAPRSEPRSRRS